MSKLLLLVALAWAAAIATPMTQDHHAQMNARGVKAMGFDQAPHTTSICMKTAEPFRSQ
jgi:hypothetical protein